MKEVEGGQVVWRHDAQGIAHARLNATPEQLVELWPHVEAVAVPTLLLRGAQSDFLSAPTAQEMQRRNRRIQYVEVPSATHYVHDDNLGGFETALHAFLGSAPLRPWAKGSAR
jgi:pimeloyl-ACP methyl ester carboxylesterase